MNKKTNEKINIKIFSNRGPGSKLPGGVRGSAPRTYALLLLLLTLALPLSRTQPAHAVQNVAMRIGIAENVSSGKLTGNGLVVTSAKGNKIAVANGSSVSLSSKGIVIGGKTFAMPVRVDANGVLGWNNIRYRGALRIVKAGKGFTVINDVDLESYLRGILKIEMNPEWHAEALKAQAILARTYAVRNRGRFGAKGFDLCATQNSQVYRGVNAEDPRTDRAVAQTVGQVLTYNGEMADVYFHSDSGGATADVSHVWGGTRAYLKSRAEVAPSQSPNAEWQLAMSPAQIGSIMGKMGKNVGTVKSVSVIQADNAGRAVTLRVAGSRGHADVKAHAFRMAAGSSVIKSTNFNVNAPRKRPTYAAAPAAVPTTPAAAINLVPLKPEAVAVPDTITGLDDFPPGVDPLVEMTKRDVFSKDEVYDMLFNPAKRDDYIQVGLQRLGIRAMQNPQGGAQKEQKTEPEKPVVTPTPVPTPAPTPAPQQTVKHPAGHIVFYGGGWGHGVGLSQWGAKAMADRGMSCTQILAHYFPGTKIAK